MIGQIKEVEIGTVYKQDKDGIDTEEVEIPGKAYELKKQGVKFSLKVQSVFIKLLMSAGGFSPDVEDSKLEMIMVAGLSNDAMIDMVCGIIKESVFTPKINDEAFEDLGLEGIPKLFLQVYMFQVGDAEKKRKKPGSSESSQTKGPELQD